MPVFTVLTANFPIRMAPLLNSGVNTVSIATMHSLINETRRFSGNFAEIGTIFPRSEAGPAPAAIFWAAFQNLFLAPAEQPMVQ